MNYLENKKISLFGLKTKMLLVFFAVVLFSGLFSGKAQAATCSCSANTAGFLAANNLWRTAWDPVGSQVDLPTSSACEQECANRGAKSYRFGTIAVFHNVSLVSQVVNNNNNSVLSTDQPTSGGGTTGSEVIPGSTESGGLIQCGRGGQRMCTLCDIIVGLNLIIKYIFRIAIALGVFGFAIAGVMYIVSAGDSSATTNAKGVMKNTTIGIIVVLSAWLIINYSMMLLGAKQNATGQNTLGLNIKGWGEFECMAKPR